MPGAGIHLEYIKFHCKTLRECIADQGRSDTLAVITSRDRDLCQENHHIFFSNSQKPYLKAFGQNYLGSAVTEATAEALFFEVAQPLTCSTYGFMTPRWI